MLNLFALAEGSLKRLLALGSDTLKGVSQNTQMLVARNTPFNDRLIEACRGGGGLDDPMSAPAELFIAAPECMLAKIAHLCLDKKSSQSTVKPPANVTDPMQENLRLV